MLLYTLVYCLHGCYDYTSGCVFRGTTTEVSEHKANCNFSDESQLLAIAIKEVWLHISYLAVFYLYPGILSNDLVHP